MALRSPRFAGNQRLQRASNNSPALCRGETGEAVRILQQALIDLGFPLPVSTRRLGTPDGIFGEETQRQLRAFQRREHLSLDGKAGHDTLGRLDTLLPNAGPPLPPLPGVAYTHKVKLHFRSISMPRVPEFTALANAQRVYDQYGILLEFASGFSMGATGEQQLVLSGADGTCNWDQASDEQRILSQIGGGRAGVGQTDILVFYADHIRESDGSTLAGCAGHRPGAPTVVVSAVGSRWTLGHEVCHVLLGPSFVPVHTTDPVNLMFSPTAGISTDPPGLTTEQVTRAQASRYCVAI